MKKVLEKSKVVGVAVAKAVFKQATVKRLLALAIAAGLTALGVNATPEQVELVLAMFAFV